MSDRKHVLLLHHVSMLSGAEKGLLDVARVLMQGGYHVSAALPGEGPLARKLSEAGVAIHTIALGRVYRSRNPLMLLHTTFRVVAATVRLVRILRRTRADILHANSDTACLFGVAAAALTRTPCLWHRRDLVELGRVGRWMGRHVVGIIAISQAVANASRAYARSDEALVLIPNGIDLDSYRPSGKGAATRVGMGVPDDAFVVANIGQLIPWKRQDLFLAAAERVMRAVPQAVFLVVGEDLFGDHADYVRALHVAAAGIGSPGRVVFCGCREDIVEVMESSDVVVHTAGREPFGRVVAEAMALGRPVVAANACGPAELIEDGCSGLLVTPDDPSAFADAVVRLAADSALCAKLGEAARRRIRHLFRLDAFGAALLERYGQIA